MSATNRFVVVFLLSWVAVATAEATLVSSARHQMLVDVAHIIFLIFILFMWAYFDASRRGTQLTREQGICIVLFGFLAVPFYLWRARPHDKRWRWIVKGFVVAILTYTIVYIGVMFSSQADI